MTNKNNKRHICILSDCFVPKQNSAAGMIYNLACSFLEDDYEVTCIFGGVNPKLNLNKSNQKFSLSGVNLVSSKFLIKYREKSNFHRFIYEIILSIILSIKSILNSENHKFDMIIWYGPSSFLWLPALILKLKHKVKVYYILRDIFPDWLFQTNIIKSKILYNFLNILALPQFFVPNVIGLETEGNVNYLKAKIGEKQKIEVLNNWNSIKRISLNMRTEKKLTIIRRKIITSKNLKPNIFQIIYTGNTSVAHDLESTINFLNINIQNEYISHFLSINLFGKINADLKQKNIITQKKIKIKFCESVPDYNLPHIFDLIDIGLITLNNNLITENIPGKFVSYTQFGLPILCFANKNTAISNLINRYNCGIVIDLTNSNLENIDIFNNFIDNFHNKKKVYSKNSYKLFCENFDIKIVKTQLISSLQKFNQYKFKGL